MAHDANMTTSTTPQSLNHRNITSTGRSGRVAVLLAGSALTVAVIGLAVQPEEPSIGANAAAIAAQPQSALLDGPSFQTAVGASIANIEVPASALLDGTALQTAIDAILVTIVAPRSALLDGPALQAAIDAILVAEAG